MAVDGSIAGMALQLGGQIQGAVGTALAQAAEPGPDVIGLLQREFQALLDWLEPVFKCQIGRWSRSIKMGTTVPINRSNALSGIPSGFHRSPMRSWTSDELIGERKSLGQYFGLIQMGEAME